MVRRYLGLSTCYLVFGFLVVRRQLVVLVRLLVWRLYWGQLMEFEHPWKEHPAQDLALVSWIWLAPLVG